MAKRKIEKQDDINSHIIASSLDWKIKDNAIKTFNELISKGIRFRALAKVEREILMLSKINKISKLEASEILLD
ncbi:MAG: hypothetical protein RR348_05770, partial [Clostridia bacterium]